MKRRVWPGSIEKHLHLHHLQCITKNPERPNLERPTPNVQTLNVRQSKNQHFYFLLNFIAKIRGTSLEQLYVQSLNYRIDRINQSGRIIITITWNKHVSLWIRKKIIIIGQIFPDTKNWFHHICVFWKPKWYLFTFCWATTTAAPQRSWGNSLLYFLNTPLCVKVNCNVSLQLTFTQFGVKINSNLNGVNFYTKWCNTRLLVATANIAEATACSVTRRSLHGPGSNFCHPPAHGVEICFV